MHIRLKYEKPQLHITEFNSDKKIMMGEDVVAMLNDLEDGNRETTDWIFSIPDPGTLD